MSIFNIFKKKRPTVVRVTFRGLNEPPPRTYGKGYIYEWKLPEVPQAGQRVLVPGIDGPSWAFVVAVNDATDSELSRYALKPVIRLARHGEGVRRVSHEVAREVE